MDTPDTVLLERWQRTRDADAFAALVNRYSGLVYSSCRRMLCNSSEAEDVTQECFIALMQTRDKVRHSLGAWLHTVAVRRCIDHIRKSSRRRRRELGYMAAVPGETLPSDLEIREVLTRVDEAIESLPAALREAIVARFLEGRQHTEIAHPLGIAESTLRYRVEQAVERIRAKLRKQGVTVTAAVLTAAFEESAGAAPMLLAANIGKLALSSVTKSGMGIVGIRTRRGKQLLNTLLRVQKTGNAGML